MNWQIVLGISVTAICAVGAVVIEHRGHASAQGTQPDYHQRHRRRLALAILFALGGTAGGSLLVTWGASVQDRAADNEVVAAVSDTVEARMGEFLAEVERARATHGGDSMALNEELSRIENEFIEWAQEFSQSQSGRELQLQEIELANRREELRVSARWRPVFEGFVHSLEGLIQAYDEEVNGSFSYELPPLPENFYVNGFSGQVTFPHGTQWRIQTFAAADLLGNLMPPSLSLERLELSADGYQTDSQVRVQRLAGPDTMLVVISRDFPALPDLELAIPREDPSEPIRSLLRNLIEAELASG